MPSRDMQWGIATLIIVAIAVSVQIGGLRADIATVRADLRADIAEVRTELRADIAEIRTDLRRMDDRLRAVEIAFGKVDQRLSTIEELQRSASSD